MPGGFHRSVTQTRKYLEAFAFVAVGMVSGWIFQLDANQYAMIDSYRHAVLW